MAGSELTFDDLGSTADEGPPLGVEITQGRFWIRRVRQHAPPLRPPGRTGRLPHASRPPIPLWRTAPIPQRLCPYFRRGSARCRSLSGSGATPSVNSLTPPFARSARSRGGDKIRPRAPGAEWPSPGRSGPGGGEWRTAWLWFGPNQRSLRKIPTFIDDRSVSSEPHLSPPPPGTARTRNGRTTAGSIQGSG